jgi:hypothetical protein
MTHRVSYFLFVGPVPAGLQVLHHCDNPSCVNPRHLFLGTQKDNMDDARRKGRDRRASGLAHWRTKTTLNDAATARFLHSTGVTQEEIARRLGISASLVRNILAGRHWTDRA